jgi:uncharacterized protein YdeI (YjbR/CyaY-like superfamily)
MSESNRNVNVDLFIQQETTWQAEFERLRTILLDSHLTEEYKWKQPCYTYQAKNIVIVGGFKQYCVLGFFKGALFEDFAGILSEQGENTQSARVIKFKNVSEIEELESVITAYIHQAIEIEQAGLQVEFKKAEEYDMPAEIQNLLSTDAALNAAFHALTPGRQKAYLLYFSSAKQVATRLSRIERYRQRILTGKGINDCTCGLSKRMPVCDGSHKS